VIPDEDRESAPRVLVVCTANRCRSPLAAALLRASLVTRGLFAEVDTAGLGEPGFPATDPTTAVAARRDLDLGDHRSQPLAPDLIAPADLVLAMERLHVRHVVLTVPSAWPYTFTLKELVRRGEAVGPRPAGASLTTWIARVHDGRDRRDLLGASPLDDLTDPTGGTLAEHEDTARELEDLLDRLVGLAWPHAGPAEPPSAP
jgi:protein-tyrosine phosphatase